MNILGRITSIPKLPDEIHGLREIAYNLWWTWNPEARGLFNQVSPPLWKRFRNNPVKLLLEIEPERLEQLSRDPAFVAQLTATHEQFKTYMAGRPKSPGQTVAYFSAEFGFHESLPIYSGGLGVLAGDHIKAASNLGLGLIGVGIFYHQGYFRQQLSDDGGQVEVYVDQHPEEMPVVPVRDAHDQPLRVGVEFPGRTLWLTAYKAQVGTVPVYLMSSNLPENRPEDRYLTARLYAPGQDMRIQQEMILGIGGVRMLRALGIQPNGWHMNEGHAAFLGLERIRELVEQDLSFEEALEVAAAGTLFTTHTPVPAGHDAFPLDLMDRFLGGWWDQIHINRNRFMALGLEQKEWGEVFSMSNLALATSRQANGVSRLHGEVSRRMFQHLWPGFEPEEIPIGHVTNGVHIWTFLARRMKALYREHFPEEWPERLSDPEQWTVGRLPDDKLWRARQGLREKLVDEVRERLLEQRHRNGRPPADLRSAEQVLSPVALTIGFARRFATYKRATLLFKDPERLQKIMRSPYPVQFVFAGKAHPQDDPGKQFIREVLRLRSELGLDDRIVLLENYDMDLARRLVQGVDIWLNTPRRPMEASGTSGMKAALNGAINLSVLDGWWAEAYNGRNGWAIGQSREFASEEAQDMADAASFYDTLENEMLPLFYARGGDGVPSGWLAKVRESVRTAGPFFSAERMVRDYQEQYYQTMRRRGDKLAQNQFALARELSVWKQQARSLWPKVQLKVEAPGDMTVNGHNLKLRALLTTAGLDEKTLRVELLTRRGGQDLEIAPMTLVGREGDALVFMSELHPSRPGSYVYGVRALAAHNELSSPCEVALVRWA